MSIKEDIYRLIDELSDEELPEARRYLASLAAKERPSLLEVLRDAPFDDEPTTPEEDEGAAEARRELARGEGRPLRETREELLRG